MSPLSQRILLCVPLLGWAVLLAGLWGLGPPLLIAVTLVALVLAAVHHAEVVAHRVGEPFGTLILAVSVTVIEVGLIVSLMLAANTVSRAKVAAVSWLASMSETISPTSITVTETARMSVPKGFPTRWATTSA